MEYETTTWKEFKKTVDKQLKELGQGDDVDIYFIDVHMPIKGQYDTAMDDIGLMVS